MEGENSADHTKPKLFSSAMKQRESEKSKEKLWKFCLILSAQAKKKVTMERLNTRIQGAQLNGLSKHEVLECKIPLFDILLKHKWTKQKKKKKK